MAGESNIDRSTEAILDPLRVPTPVATVMYGVTLPGFRMSLFAPAAESCFVWFS